MNLILTSIIIFVFHNFYFAQIQNIIGDKKNNLIYNEPISESYNSNSITNFSTKKLAIEIKQADASMIIKETPPELLKCKKIAVKQADASMIVKETPTELLKHKSLTIKQADASMIIKETPPELLKQKFK